MNMRKMDDLNLKDAFAPMPDTCHAALMNAARSAKEEENVKRASFRMALIAAAIIVATMVAAFAATQLGLIDFFNNHYNIPLPDSAKTVLSATEQKTYTVGPLAITLRETLADGRIAYLTTQAKTYDGSKALIQMSNGDISDHIPNSEATRLKVPENTTFLDAAIQANVPLYFVSSYLTIDGSYMGGEGMQDILWDTDGSAMLVNMLMTNPDTVPETLKGTLTLRVREIDPATSSYAEGKDWKIEEEISIPVNGVTTEKTYAPSGEAQLAGFTVQSVKAEQTCAGIYLTATLTAGADTKKDDAQILYDFVEFKDAQGQIFPAGMSLSGSLNDVGWPTVIWDAMISADALPDAMQLVNGKDGSAVTLK